MMLGGHENNTMYPPEGGCFSVRLLLQVIKVYNEDNTSRAIEVPNDISARDICQLFVLKNNCIDDHSWTLFEHLSLLGIGKTQRQKKGIFCECIKTQQYVERTKSNFHTSLQYIKTSQE